MLAVLAFLLFIFLLGFLAGVDYALTNDTFLGWVISLFTNWVPMRIKKPPWRR